jgi:Flp pilus assembly pilin Flp
MKNWRWLNALKQTRMSALLRRVHKDQRGAVTLETVLIIGAIALPVLAFLVLKAWPKIKGYFETGTQNLDEGIQQNFP